MESRLRQRFASAGSTLFSQTWKEKATPAGRSYSAHTASAHRTSGSGSGSWPTPQARDGGTPKTPEQIEAIRARCKAEGKGNPGFANLNEVVRLASWPTPTVQDDNRDRMSVAAKEREMLRGGRGVNGSLVLAALTASGPTSNGSPAETAKPGQLNPAFSRWLMGLPPAWDDFAPTETRSMRKRAPNSPAPSSK